MKGLLIITGPTATGKTDLGVHLAKKFNGEIIAADSRQIYQGLDLISGKYPASFKKVEKFKNHWIVDGVKIWMYDVVATSGDYNLFQYIADAKKFLRKITQQKKLPIIVGGTGFYIKGLLEGLTVGVGKTNLRQTFEDLTLETLQKELQKLNPTIWMGLNNSDKNNRRRLTRLIEIYSTSKNTRKLSGVGKKFATLKIGLTARREFLYKRVNERVMDRIKKGMIEEASKLHKSGMSFKRMFDLGLELRALAYFLQEKITSVELIEYLQVKIRNYLKRQLTWFKKDGEINWFDIEQDSFQEMIENAVMKWYDTVDESKY